MECTEFFLFIEKIIPYIVHSVSMKKNVFLLNSFDALFTKKLMANTCAAAFLHKLEDQDLDREAIPQYISSLNFP